MAQEVITKVIEVEAGRTFDVTLWEDRTAGHSWTPRYRPDALDLIDDDYRRTVNVDTADFGKRVFTFLAKAPGEHSLVMELRVGWKFTADNRNTYLVRIRAASSTNPSLN